MTLPDAAALDDDEWLLDPEEARVVLDRFLAPYEMWPDARAQVEREFFQYGSLYYAIVKQTDAYQRIVDTIRYALTHHGNVVAEIDGWQRLGKSTLARWLARLLHQFRTGTPDGWEDHIIYEQAYSDTSNRLQDVTERLIQAHSDSTGTIDYDAVLGDIDQYRVIQDEQEIEHHEQSLMAVHDVMNLVVTCASAQIDFIFVSVLRRNIGAYFRLWVVGIDPVAHANLAFYYDTDGFCHGAIRTPQIAETATYKPMKAKMVVEMLRTGGRKPAVKKVLTPNNGATTEFDFAEAAQGLEANPDVLGMLRAYSATALRQAGRTGEAVKRWELATFDGLSASEIKRQLEETVTVRAINDSIEKTRASLSEVAFGAILERVATDYLKRETSKGSTPTATSTPSSGSDLVRNLSWHRRGGPDAPDVVLIDAQGTVHASVACKYYPGARQNLWDCRPEHASCPPCSWLLLIEPDARTNRLHHAIYRLPPTGDGLVTRGFLTKLKVKWEVWVAEMRALTGAPPASSPGASPPPPGD